MLCCHSWFDFRTKMWMQTACLQRMPFRPHIDTLCFLTFSGLSDEASTKDWEKCTIPTFLFSQNLWHQELGEVFRQSSYSPAGYNTTGQWGKRGKRDTVKESEESEKGMKTILMPRFLPGWNIRKIFCQACKTSELIMQKHWQWKKAETRTEQGEVKCFKNH